MSNLFSKLAKIAEVRKLTEDERTAYDTSLRKYRDTIAVMTTARNEGIEKGFEKGRKEGRLETTREFVLNMVKAGLSVSQIQMITGLTADEINRCKN